ncbi:diaminopimelate decarboxylase [Haloarcula salinisoli]|uniref:Diaminopimelate decarboxylase n=1 Tax=Haloarcula salinisoli TaxID=2487746 RepID=A0A8J7YMJ1_9EURY|nr:diaminopimelate decarboxylase [Halomicroarcula salinisoli]MBX0288604.1 diaminopimelate decarboxylase [Halomicroarcula salinisoli]MBX0306016.1 diaminopimelate decarboxylase [Halomicroarcula salinisoli]
MSRTIAERKERLAKHADEVAESVGTPALIFFEADVRRQYDRLRSALDAHYPDSTVHVAVKANLVPGLLGLLADRGANAEAYANCEFEVARRADFDPADILLTGMNRDESTVRRILQAGTSQILVDNISELRSLASVSRDLGIQCDVLLRVNPAVDIPTHPAITTGDRGSKFGMSVASGSALEAVRRTVDADGLRLHGLHCHLGSQIDSVEPYKVATQSLMDFVAEVRKETDETVDVLDIGGGFPIQYRESVPDIEAYAAAIGNEITAACTREGLDPVELYLEPGRYLLGPCGTLLGSVGVLKETPERRFAVLDAGTNTVLTRQEVPIYSPDADGEERTYAVVGPLCYSADVFDENVTLQRLAEGDLVAIDKVGAYTVGREMHLNGAPRPPIVIIGDDGHRRVVREREACEDVIPGVNG